MPTVRGLSLWSSCSDFHSDELQRAHARDLLGDSGILALYVSLVVDNHMIVELELQHESAVVIFVISDGGLLATFVRQYAVN